MGRRKPKPPPPPPPDHLSDRAKKLWTTLVGNRVQSPGRMVAFRTALECLDRADEAAAIVNAEGLVTKTKTTGAIHLHPLLKAEVELRRQFLTAWRRLGLDFDWRTDGRIEDGESPLEDIDYAT